VLIIYFDEVKYQHGVQPYQWISGIAVDALAVRSLEAELAQLAEESFSSGILGKETELHAAEILAGKGNCKGKPLAVRVRILEKIALILSDDDRIGRIYSRIDVSRVDSDHDPADFAFLYFVEKANAYARALKQLGLLIGDFANDREVSRSTRNLSHFRANGTPYEFGQQIENLIDTVHFAHSHHSRMLQLADAYCWFQQLRHGPSAKKEPQSRLLSFIADNADGLWPHKYREWPTQDSRRF
jgi:hypothetical protein